MEHLFAAVATQPIGRFSTRNYATFSWHTETFWGNDAFVSDGFFDIPTPQMSTWPDKFYHSSMDTPDQMSDNTLGRSGAIVGTYLYLMATAGAQEALWFAGLAARDWKRRICHELTMEALKGDAEIQASGRHLGFQGQDAVKQALRFAPDDDALGKTIYRMCNDMKEFAGREAGKAVELASALSGQDISSASKELDYGDVDQRGSMVVKRLRWGVPSDSVFSEAGQVKVGALRERVNGNLARIWEWINGRRTFEEIWERVQFGGHIPYNVIAEYLELLAAEGFVARLDH